MEFSEQALAALGQADHDKDPIDDLEFIGVPPRTLSILQKNGIITMDILLSKTPQELCTIKSLNTPSIDKLLSCLQHYDEVAILRK